MRKNKMLTLAKDEIKDVMGGWTCKIADRTGRYKWFFSEEEIKILKENKILYNGKKLFKFLKGDTRPFIFNPISSDICGRLEELLGRAKPAVVCCEEYLFDIVSSKK